MLAFAATVVQAEEEFRSDLPEERGGNRGAPLSEGDMFVADFGGSDFISY